MSNDAKLLSGWDPADPLPWIVLTCPGCGRLHRLLAVGLYSRTCDCGAVFHRGFWAWTPSPFGMTAGLLPAQAAGEADEPGEA